MVGKRLQRFYLLYCQINILWEEIILSEGGNSSKKCNISACTTSNYFILSKGCQSGPGSDLAFVLKECCYRVRVDIRYCYIPRLSLN